MPKATTPVPMTARLSATEIARRAARSDRADAGAGFAEQGDVRNPLGGGGVIVPATGVRISPEVRVTLPRMLGSDAQGQAATQARTEAAEPATIASPADLGRLVRAVRERRDFSQQAFADLAGVGRRFLSELENGKSTLELGKVLKVANAAGIVLFARQR